MTLTPLQLFNHLADETRLNLVLILRVAGERCSCELSTVLNESLADISRLLVQLKESRILCARQEGAWSYYRLSVHMPVWAASVIEQAFQCQRDEVLRLCSKLEHDYAMTNGKAVCL